MPRPTRFALFRLFGLKSVSRPSNDDDPDEKYAADPMRVAADAMNADAMNGDNKDGDDDDDDDDDAADVSVLVVRPTAVHCAEYVLSTALLVASIAAAVV